MPMGGDVAPPAPLGYATGAVPVPLQKKRAVPTQRTVPVPLHKRRTVPAYRTSQWRTQDFSMGGFSKVTSKICSRFILWRINNLA